jgi:hypothetical protein
VPIAVPEDANVAAQVLSRIGWMPRDTRLAEVPNPRTSVQATALEWQTAGVQAQWLEIHGVLKGAGEGRVSELVGRAAAAGEQLGLAWTLDQELQRWYAAADDHPGLSMAARALAEMCGYYVLSAAHGLGNITVRTLAVNEASAKELDQRRPRAQGFPPFSERREAWPPFTRALAMDARAAGRATGEPSVNALCDVLVNLVEDARWNDMERQRHDDYHRWRVQGLPGGTVPRRSLWDRPSAGSMRLSGGGNFYEPVDHRALATIAGDALDALGDAMARWDALWPAALRDLGLPLFKVDC